MTEETMERVRKVAIIAFPGITRDEALSIAEALKKETDGMGLTVFITNAAVETMSREEFLSVAKSISESEGGAT